MARTKEEARAYNSQRMKDYNARKRAEKAAAAALQTPGGVAQSGDVTPPGETGPTVNVKVDETPKPQPSLKDRILGKFNQAPSAAAAPAKKPAARGKKTENLVTTAMPSVVCAFIATYSRDLVHDPYKMCAPSQDEVSGILGPLFDILGREVELTGKASQNTIDLINSLLCGMMYGFRAFMTYRQIKELESPANGTNTNIKSSISRPGSYSHQAPGFVGHNSFNTASSEATPTATSDAERSDTDNEDGTGEGVDPEAQLISHMFKRDIEGRRRLGLLPTGV